MPHNDSNRSRSRRNLLLALVLISLPLVWMVPSYIVLGRRTNSNNTICQTHLQQLHQALKVYADKHGGRLPDAARWVDEVAPLLADSAALRCPADKTAGRSSYAFNANLSGRRLSDLPDRTVLIYEAAKAGENPSGTGADVIKLGEKALVTGSNLLGGRHNGMGYRFNYYLFADGAIRHPTYTTDMKEYRW